MQKRNRFAVMIALPVIALSFSTTRAQADFRLVIGADVLRFVAGEILDASCRGPYLSAGHTAPATSFFEIGISGSYHEALDGYGWWNFEPSVGVDVWFPIVDHSWRPYLNGHWIYTNRGITWVSYEPWGWLPHHYGRWVHFGSRGWGWIPGYDYAPAWVTWGVVDGYVGWAPLPPATFRYESRISYSFGGDRWAYGYDNRHGYDRSGVGFDLWIFVENRYFYDTPVCGRALPVDRSRRFFTTRRVLPAGTRLDIDYVRKISPRRVSAVSMERSVYRVGRRKMERYRPVGQKAKIRAGRSRAVGLASFSRASGSTLKRVTRHDAAKAKRGHSSERSNGKTSGRHDHRKAKRR